MIVTVQSQTNIFPHFPAKSPLAPSLQSVTVLMFYFYFSPSWAGLAVAVTLSQFYLLESVSAVLESSLEPDLEASLVTSSSGTGNVWLSPLTVQLCSTSQSVSHSTTTSSSCPSRPSTAGLSLGHWGLPAVH